MAELSNYAFLPWLRQGIGSKISEKDTLGKNDGSIKERASFQVDVTMRDVSVDGTKTNDTVFSKSIKITGPGDVVGIHPKVVVRTEPKANLSNFETNNLAYIEFYEEDFLWRYTPASPDNAIQNGQRLRPWLSLVVLKDEEFKLMPNPAGLTFISVANDKFDKAFHAHTDVWAFGHVHLTQSITNNGALSQEVSTKLRTNPDTGLSRLICPRKLQKNTHYTAFLIPTFETGRLAGLGIDPTSTNAQAPAWKLGAAMNDANRKRPFDFPIYYYWEFKTGNSGDFESLVSILKPTIIESEGGNGVMPMDIQKSGYGLDGKSETKVLGFEGAIRPADFDLHREIFPKNTSIKDKDYQSKLNKLLNLSSDLISETEAENIKQTSLNPFYDGVNYQKDDPIIVPPVYGTWHILAQRVGVISNPEWFNTVNLDPRFRAAAGLGTKIVQQNQEDLMNRAWQQIDEVNEANKKIRQAELIKTIANAIFKKHVASASNDKIISMTNAVHAMMKMNAGGITVQQEFKLSRIPIASKTPAFQKLLRPTAKNLSVIPEINVNVISKFNDTQKPLTAALLKETSDGVLDGQKITNAINLAVESFKNDNIAMAKDLFFTVAKNVNLTGTLAASKTALNAAVGASASSPIIKAETQKIISEIIQIVKSVDNPKAFIITIKKAKYEEVFYDASKKTGEDNKSSGTIEVRKEGFVPSPTISLIGSVALFQDVKNYQVNYNTFLNSKKLLPQPTLLPQFQQFGSIQTKIRTNIFPEFTFIKRFLPLLLGIDKKPLGALKPIMAYPIFKEPTYEYLLKLSKDYILPNVNKLEKNSITLLEANPNFIEAFMLGLNHEMARELLWREYPTDQRGSYFRQFWSVKDSNIFPKPAEELLDIKEIHKWQGKLGKNSRGATLVLVIRGELLQKYPDTMIYAQKASYDTPPNKARKLPNSITEANTKFPLFKAEIEPDITLVGFDLTDKEAMGDRLKKATDSATGKNPGWFFVLKQRPGHISFGFDDFTDQFASTDGMPPSPQKWEDMTWENLITNKDELKDYHLKFDKNFAPTTNPSNYQWNKNSADLAAILYQNPVIFARHAAEMLPADI